MTKKIALCVAITTVAATAAVKGYQLLDQRYRHLLPPKEQYRLPRDTESVVVRTSIGDFKLVAAGGYFGGTGIYVIVKSLVNPDDFNRRVLRGDSISHTQVVPVVTEELTKAFYEATEGQFHLEPAPHTSSGGNSNAFALITAGTNHDAHLKHQGVNPYRYSYDNSYPDGPSNDELNARFEALPSYSGYFKWSDAPTMRMAAHTLRTIIDGSPLNRTKSDLRSIAEGSRPVHTLHDLHTAKTITEQLAGYYKSLALTGLEACKVRVAEFRSKD